MLTSDSLMFQSFGKLCEYHVAEHCTGSVKLDHEDSPRTP